MKPQFDDFFLENSPERWRVIRRSILYTFGVATFMLSLGSSPDSTSVAAAIIAVVSYYGQLNTSQKRLAASRPVLEVFSWRTALAPVCYAALGVFCLCMLVRSPGVVDAAVVKWRIKTVEAHLDKTVSSSGPPLAKLTKQMTAARQQNIPIGPAVQREIRESLAAATNLQLPGYLPAAGALINYGSPRLEGNPPDCLDTAPEHLYWRPLDPGSPISGAPPDQLKFTSCRLNLDSPDFAERFQPKTQNDAISLVCDKCQVVYNGGDLPVAKLKGFVNLIFTDCAFAVNLTDNSPVEARGLVSAILSSPDINHVNYIAAGKDIWSGNAGSDAAGG